MLTACHLPVTPLSWQPARSDGLLKDPGGETMLNLFMIILAAFALAAAAALHALAASPAGQLFSALFGSWADQCRNGPELHREPRR